MTRRILIGCLALLCALLPFASAVTVAAESGVHHVSMAFQSTRESNYRIPNAVATKDGKVLLFANDRGVTSSDASAQQALSVSISTDGVNFSAPRAILSKPGWTYVLGSLVYDAETNKVLVIYSGLPRSAEAMEEFGKIPPAEREPTGMSIVESDDCFETWTQRKAYFPAVTEPPYMAPGTHGCNTGIQLTRGEYAGRLVIPGLLSTSNEAGMKNQIPNKHVCLIYSDDHGMTWKVSNVSPDGCSESAVAELSDGTVYLNCRCLYGNSRWVGVSRDGGATIEEMHLDPTLLEPDGGGCKGSLLTVPDGKGGQLLLYANATWPTARKNFCIWVSEDDGKTWSSIAVLEKGTTAYSSMAYNPVTGYITVIYEYAGHGIRQETFDLTWLRSRLRPYVPFRINSTPEAVVPGVTEAGLVVKLTSDGLPTGDGGAWKDTSENGNDAVRGVGYKMPGVMASACGNLPAMSFTGTEALEISGDTLPTGDLTAFLVFRAGEEPENDTNVLLSTDSLNYFSVYLYGKGQTFATAVQTGRISMNILSNTLLDTEWHILALTWSGEDIENACMTQFMDGSHDDVKYCIREDAAIASKETNRFTVGSGFTGEIGSVLIWNRALSDTEVAETGLALAETYGLSWSGVGTREPEPAGEAPTGTDTTGASPTQGGGCASGIQAVLPAVFLPVIGISLTQKRRKRR